MAALAEMLRVRVSGSPVIPVEGEQQEALVVTVERHN